jgi:hypothetical protein
MVKAPVETGDRRRKVRRTLAVGASLDEFLKAVH